MISATQRLSLLILFVLLGFGSLFTGLLFGSVDIPFSEIAQALLSSADSAVHQIVWQLRLPRVMAAFACGGLLALAGALLQVLLRNPLADPYILGVSGGAAVGALVGMLLGWSILLVNLASLAGALAVIALVFGLSFRAPRCRSSIAGERAYLKTIMSNMCRNRLLLRAGHLIAGR